MNDFTKEELDFVFKYMTQCGSRSNLSKYNDVLVKLKAMIDNYCEHTENYICMECLSATCEKCHKIWELKDDNQ